MDPNIQRQIDNFIVEQRSSDWIIQTLIANPDFDGDVGEIYNYLNSKKKEQESETTGGFTGQEIHAGVTPGSASEEGVSVSESGESEPISLTPGEIAWGMITGGPGNPFLGRAKMIVEKIEEAKTRDIYGGLEEYRKYFKDTDFTAGFNEQKANQIATSAEELIKQMSPQMVKEVNQDGDLIAEIEKIRSEYRVGSTIKVYETVTRGGAGGMYQDIVARDVTVTKELLDKKIDEARGKALDEKYYNTIESDVREKVLEMIPEEYRDDEEFLRYLTDKIFVENKIDLDLDGNGRIKEQGALSYLGAKFRSGTENLITGFVDSIDYIFTGDDVGLAKKRGVQQEKAREKMMEFSKGISSSIGSGDYYNAALQMGGGIAETLPIIGLTATTGGYGVAAIGFSGFGNAYTEALNDPEYGDNYYGRIGYAVASGVSDAAFAYVGNHLFKTANARALAASSSAERSAIIAGKEGWVARNFTKQALGAYARRKGLAVASEAFEEAATEISTSLVEAAAKGQEVNFPEMFERALDAAIIGGVAGGAFDSLGSMMGKSTAMSYARASATATRAVEAEMQAAQLRKQAQETTDPTQKRRLNMLADGLIRDAERARKARTGFYDMLQTRHPEAARTLMETDIEIEALARQLKDENISEETKASLKKALENKVRSRVDLENSFNSEDLNLTNEEKQILFDNTKSAHAGMLQGKIDSAQMAVDEHVDREGTESYNPEARRIAEENLEKSKQDLDKFNKLVESYLEAVSELESVVPTEGFSEADLQEKQANVEAALNALSEHARLDMSAYGSVGKVGEFIKIQDQITHRYSGQWLVESVEALENSSLTREALEGILGSDNWAMLTGENPSGVAVGDGMNGRFNARAEKWLKDKGLKYHKIVGRYNAGENSFLVEGMTREQAAEFAKVMGQESVAHKDGLVQADGSINLFEEGGATYGSEVDTESDYMSVIKDKDGNIISFSFMPSGKFQDSDGGTITEAEYGQRAKDNYVEATEIEARIQEEIEDLVKSQNESKQQEETAPTEKTDSETTGVETPFSKDGSPNWRAGENGIENSEQASTLNKLSKLAKAIGIKVVVHADEASAAAVDPERGSTWGGLWHKGAIHLQPKRISLNQYIESQAGYKKLKTFNETVAEEVLHILIGPMLNKMYTTKGGAKKLRGIAEGILKYTSKNDPEMHQRLMGKLGSYESEGEMIMLEEMVIEFLSAVVSDPGGVKGGTIDKFRLGMNSMLSFVGSGLSLKDAAAMINVAKNYDLSSSADSGFDVTAMRLMSRRSQEQSNRASEALLPPHKLAPDSDGKVRVTMYESFYRWRNGVKKSIGEEKIQKEFSDQWHFINWWKKATKMGEDSHFFGFQTSDGQVIDVEKIKNYKSSRASSLLSDMSSVSGVNQDTRSMAYEAVKQGLISRVVANRITNKIKRFETDSRPSSLAKAKSFNEYVKASIDRAASQVGKKFNYNVDDVSRASDILWKVPPRDYTSGTGLEVVKALQDLTGIKMIEGEEGNETLILKPSTVRFIHSKIVSDFARNGNLSPSEALAVMMGHVMDPTYVKRFFSPDGSLKNPKNYFKSYNSEAREKITKMVNSGKIYGSVEDNLNRLNFIVALTSPQNEADTNIETALEILQATYDVKGRDTRKMVGFEIIDYISNGDAQGINIDRGKIPYTRQSIASLLEKFDALILSGQDFQGLNVPASIKRALVEEVKQNGPFQDGNGNVDWNRVMEFLMRPYQGQKETTQDLVFAQKIFNVKVGAWILNLSSEMYPDLKNEKGEGMQDIVTLDTHALNVTSLYKGEYLDLDARILASVTPLMRAINRISGKDKYLISHRVNLNSENLSEVIDDGRNLIDEIAEKRRKGIENGTISKEEAKKLQDQIRSIERALEKAENHPASVSAKSLFDSRRIIRKAAEMLDVSPAVLQQVMFADSRIMSQRIKLNLNEFTQFFSYRKEYKTYGSVLARKNFTSEPGPDAESRASGLLLFPDQNSELDVDSPLFRRRAPEEALKMRDGSLLNDKVISDALSTDATSRRIIEKGIQIKTGDKVGIRLNLNVMKNTGIPVQTMHEKSASGEALKYSAAVMVKNPVLFVNQNARKKIVTFQENKFPMASVDGEFLSDNLEEMNFDGVKAFFNPFKQNVFVDASGRPIKSAGEATIVGNTVYLRGKIEYFDYGDPILDRGRSETDNERAKRVKRGPKYEKALSRFAAFSERNGIQFADRAELEEAYDNMPIESMVALDASEVAKNMADAQSRASKMLKIRQTAGKAARQYGGDVRKQILDNPANYFTPQTLKDIKNDLFSKSDSDLIDLMSNQGLGRLQDRNDDLGVLASAELINRAVARGDLNAIPSIIEEAAAMGTTAGRILRHLRELKSASPKGIEQIVKSAVERRGNKLSSEQTSRLQDMAGNLFRLQAEHEDLVRRAIAGEDVDAELKAKTDEVKAAERLLDTFVNGVVERGWGEIGTMLIQGNLLTPMSQITNVGANLINAIGKVGVDIIALPVERLINAFGIESPMKRNYSINAYMYGIRKFGAGFVEALDGIITGQESDVSEWRIHRGFAPFRSLASAMGKGDLPMGPDGKAPLNQRLKLFVQGTLGIPAEVMFRFLSLGDVPFRRYVEGIELYHAGRSQGLEGDALAQFIKHPTKKDREAAEREGRKLTYQEQTGASKAAEDAVAFFERMFTKAFDWIPGADGRAMAKFLIRSNLPYVRTPANILIDTLTYVSPYVAGPRIMKDLQNGNARDAAQNFGKLIVGSMVSQTAVLMLKEGLISGAIEWDEDEEKNIAYDQFPPNSINVSGLQRFLNGEDTSKRPDDRFVSYTKLGVMGAIIGAIVKGADKEELKNRDYSALNFPIHAIQDSFGVGAFSSIAYMMDQSFLQGMNTLVDVISSSEAGEFERNFENWFRTTFQAVSATVFPNTLSAMYRGTREYLPDTRVTKDMPLPERLVTRMAYTIKDRTFGLGDVPIRVDWKGNPIKQTPRGNNGIAYQLFDITKSRQGEADPVSNEIWRLYEQTEDLTTVVGTPGYAENRKLNVPNVSKKHARMISSMSKSYTWINDEEFMAERIYLNTEQINRLMEASGKERYAEVEKFISTERYAKMNDEEKVEALNEIADNYNSAIEIDRGRFRNHTLVLFDIMQEIYDNEREEI